MALFSLGNRIGDRKPTEFGSVYSDYGPVEAADLARDGHLDIAFLPQLVGSELLLLRGRGDGSFGAVAEFPTGQALNSSFVLSDLNGDAKPEALVEAYIDLDFTVLLNTSRPRR